MLCLQSCCNIEEAAAANGQSEPYILVSENLYHLIVESSFTYSCENLPDALMDLMCYYYVLNMKYPKSMYALYIFFQHFVLGLKDNSRIPTCVYSIF